MTRIPKRSGEELPSRRSKLAFLLLGSLSARTLVAQVTSGPFTMNVSPNPVVFPAGGAGTATVTLTAAPGFLGSVALTCATGAPVSPVGYSCSFAPSTVPVGGSPSTATLTLAPTASSVSGAATARSEEPRMWLLNASGSAAACLLLLGLLAWRFSESKRPRNFLLMAGLTLATLSGVGACGGGGGSSGGGGQVNTTTTISSSNLHVGFGTAVTFSITVTPNGNATPSGQVQILDNGQPLGASTQVSAGIASFLATSLPVGVNSITAQYLGDAHTLPSTSAPIMQFVAGTVTMQMIGTSGSTMETANFSATLL